MNTSEHIDQIATALAKAQAEIQNPAKAASNPHFKSRYADLAGGLATIRPTLAAHGLSVIQMTNAGEDIIILHTRIMHASGQWIESTYPVCRLGKHQEMGSALTYARRYALFAAVGVAGEDDDDDGNSAATPPKRNGPNPTYVPQREVAPPPSDFPGDATARTSAHALKAKQPDRWGQVTTTMRSATTLEDLKLYAATIREEVSAWPESWRDQLQEIYDDEYDRLKAVAA